MDMSDEHRDGAPDPQWAGEEPESEEREVALTPVDIIAASEFERQLDYARRHPRKLSIWKRRSLELVTFDEAVATKCFYALPRKERNKDTGKQETKIIQGPSARFAEIIVSSWGNCKAAARVAGEDAGGQHVRGQGTFIDLETNFSCGFEISRRITNKDGKKFSADMIQVTGNAAASIAYRNAALKGIPGALWNPIFEAAKRAAVGDIKSLKKKREEIIAIFNKMGIPTEVIYTAAAIKGIDDIDGEVLLFLKGLENAIRDADTDVETILTEWSKTRPQDASPGIFKGRTAVQEAVERAKAPASGAEQPSPATGAAPPQSGPAAAPAQTGTTAAPSAEQQPVEKEQPAPGPAQAPASGPGGNSGTLFGNTGKQDKKK